MKIGRFTRIADLNQWHREKIDQNLDCIYYIISNLLISFKDESRKIKAASRTSSYRWKGEQTFIIYVSYLYVTRYGSIWFLIEKFKKVTFKTLHQLV